MFDLITSVVYGILAIVPDKKRKLEVVHPAVDCKHCILRNKHVFDNTIEHRVIEEGLLGNMVNVTKKLET